jgi:hypothetical protein
MYSVLQRFVLLIGMALLCVNVGAQSAINLKVGVIGRQFQDELDSGSTRVHYGKSIGLDAIVEDSWVLFMPGLHYQNYAIVGAEKGSGFFEKSDNFHQISLPVNLGTRFGIDRALKVRVYGGGHINFIVGVDSNSTGVNLDRVQTVHPGWQAGAQVMVWRLTADFRYYRDYRHLINVRPDSEVKGWEFLVGIAF